MDPFLLFLVHITLSLFIYNYMIIMKFEKTKQISLPLRVQPLLTY